MQGEAVLAKSHAGLESSSSICQIVQFSELLKKRMLFARGAFSDCGEPASLSKGYVLGLHLCKVDRQPLKELVVELCG